MELLDVFVDRKSIMSPKQIFLVFHPAEQDLQKFIDNQHSLLEKKKVLVFMKKILNGLSFIHRKNFIQRDMKPSNVLLFPGDEIKICDFGMAWQPGDHKLTRRRTQIYMAPEMMLESYNYDGKIDIWVISR